MYRQSRRKASLTERARRYLCPGGSALRRCPHGLPCFFHLIIGGRCAPSTGESIANLTFGGPRRGCGSLGTASRSLMSLIDTDATARYARL